MPSGLSGSLQTSFGPLVAYALAAIIVLALIGLVFLVAKRASAERGLTDGMRRGPRLAVVDVAAIDQRRKLVLVRRDDVEHLMLIGGQNDLIVEGGILRIPPALRQPTAERASARGEPDGGPGRPVAAANRPAVIAPQPRPANEVAPKVQSPLRRAIPLPDAQAVAQSAPAQAPAVPAEIAEPEPTPPLAPPAASNAPGPAAAAAPAARPRSATITPPLSRLDDDGVVPPPFEVEPTETTSTPPSVSAEPEIVVVRSHPSGGAGRTDEAQTADRRMVESDPRIPSFLRRGDQSIPNAPSAVREDDTRRERPTRPGAVPGVPVFERLSPSSIGLRRAEAGTAAPNARVETGDGEPPREPATQRPPAVVQAGRSEPIANRTSSTAAMPPATPAAPIDGANAGPNAFEDTADGGDRGPLSVRSFATAIRSRRPTYEPARAAAPPAEESSLFPQRVPPPAVSRSPAEPAVAAPAAVQVGQRSESDDLDEALTRGLNSDFDSLDWAVESPAPQIGKAEKAPEPAPAVPAGPSRTKRQEMLEKEMERLLGDFDFGAPRR